MPHFLRNVITASAFSLNKGENGAERLPGVIDNHWRSLDGDGEIKVHCVHVGVVTNQMNNCGEAQSVYLTANLDWQLVLLHATLFSFVQILRKVNFLVITDCMEWSHDLPKFEFSSYT